MDNRPQENHTLPYPVATLSTYVLEYACVEPDNAIPKLGFSLLLVSGLLAGCGGGSAGSAIQSTPAPTIPAPGTLTHWQPLARPATRLHRPLGLIKTARWPKESVFSPDGRYVIATPSGTSAACSRSGVWRT